MADGGYAEFSGSVFFSRGEQLRYDSRVEASWLVLQCSGLQALKHRGQLATKMQGAFSAHIENRTTGPKQGLLAQVTKGLLVLSRGCWPR